MWHTKLLLSFQWGLAALSPLWAHPQKGMERMDKGFPCPQLQQHKHAAERLLVMRSSQEDEWEDWDTVTFSRNGSGEFRRECASLPAGERSEDSPDPAAISAPSSYRIKPPAVSAKRIQLKWKYHRGRERTYTKRGFILVFFYIQLKESGVCPAGTTKGQETLGPPGRHGLEVGKGCWPNTLLAEQHRTASPRYLLFVNEICSSVQAGEGLKSTNNSSP